MGGLRKRKKTKKQKQITKLKDPFTMLKILIAAMENYSEDLDKEELNIHSDSKSIRFKRFNEKE